MPMTIDDIQKVKLEDGDILHVSVNRVTYPEDQVRRFRKKLEADIRERFGDKCFVIVSSGDPGDFKMEITKCNELNDIYQRLDELETLVGGQRKELDNLDEKLAAHEDDSFSHNH